jgi:hypothetical protein
VTTKAEYFQKLFKEYAREHDHAPVSTKEVAKWAVRQGKLSLPALDPLDVLTSQMAKALRDETETNSEGTTYRTNHAVREKKDGI